MIKGKISFLILFIAICNVLIAQNVPVLNYSVNSFGQVELEIEAQADQYYLLTAQHEPNFNYESITSLTLGEDGNMIISEPLGAFSLQNYKITAHSRSNPDDTDGDGIDDITEFNNMPFQAPLNFAEEIGFNDGAASINSLDIFSQLAVINDDIPWAPFLNNQAFVKFAIVNQDSEEPEVFFINSNTHYIHADFLNTINVDQFNDEVVTGEVVYNPNEILPNGSIGRYLFNFSFGDSYSFEHTRRTFELLARNMPYLNNNLQHFIGTNGENAYNNIYKNDYEGSRLNVVLETDLFADVDFIPFNQEEGYGLFRLMQLDENPGSRDVVLYDALPNSLPRVGGIMTSIVQTPLSHVNLRAIQDKLPNAYIRDPLEIDSIATLIGKYVYYKVEQDRYVIREASLEEVNDWYEDLRPTEPQIPERDLTQTSILPLDEIGFEMSNAFGAKCTNVATMRTFGFSEGTIPNGFGIPFYFYDEFMKYNGFYDKVEVMLANPDFSSNLEMRIEILKEFRKEIKDADMPQWMLDELQAMHDSFPEGTSVRCRSSTNNEDLPGFSGAGLYTSKTQHPDEGHISKSVKQVYASMWNFRAYDERDFYRVDQYIAAMGLLCHPNYEEEKSNGVGVSIDPIYQTENTFYLNTQVGESLITNPEANAVPEEILLNQDPEEGYFVLRNSNLVPEGELVMGEEYLDQMRSLLKVIHDEFEILYNVVGAEGFGMDIEYKVTAQDQLIVKQARPWVSFWAEIKSTFDLAVEEIVNPQSSSTLGDAELVTAKIANRGLRNMKDFEISLLVEDQVVQTLAITDELSPQSTAEYQFTLPQDFSSLEDYKIGTIVSHPSDGYATNDTLITVISKLHHLEGGITAELDNVKCGEEIDVKAKVTNYGEATFDNTKIEVVVNGMIVDTVDYNFNIPYLAEIEITITVTENLQQNDNVITLNLLSVNGESDAVLTNNSSSFITNLDSENDYVTLVINSDDYPAETSWTLYDDISEELVASGGLTSADQIYTQEICVDYNSCLTLFVFDSYSDGICCGYGEGNFLVLNNTGDTLVMNNGDFGNQAEEPFCPSGLGCILSAEILTTEASAENATDGIITINPSNGTAPYTYSIDGGETFVATNIFNNLAAGEYMIIVKDASENCIYEETIILEFTIVNSVDDASQNNIKLFPNPTTGDFVIEIDQIHNTNGIVKIDVYNNLGRLIQLDRISKSEGALKTTVSLKSHSPGSYFVKCYNQHFEKYFKVIKM